MQSNFPVRGGSMVLLNDASHHGAPPYVPKTTEAMMFPATESALSESAFQNEQDALRATHKHHSKWIPADAAMHVTREA